jgi:DKNYY family
VVGENTDHRQTLTEMKEIFNSPNKSMKTILLLSVIFTVGAGIVVAAKYYLFRLGKAVNAEVSNSYFYHSIKNIIVYAPNGNWFELDYVELDADKDSFEPLARDFGKDNKSIFWQGKRQDVHYATFYIDADGVARDSNHVYSTGGWQKQLAVVPIANPQTYHRFDTGIENWNRYWYRDDKYYFYENKVIEADYKTFKRINHTIAVDTNSIFAVINKQVEDSSGVKEVREVVRKSSVLSGTVQAVNDDYARIGNTIILSNWNNEFSILPFDKINSLKIIDERNIVVNDQLISDGKIIPEIDIPTFTVLHRDYFRDKNIVFHNGSVIPGALVASFEILSEDYSKDSHAVFYKNQKVEDASPATFQYYNADLGVDGTKRFKAGKLITTDQ